MVACAFLACVDPTIMYDATAAGHRTEMTAEGRHNASIGTLPLS